MDDNALEHYGVRGMKWGVRRYQKKDGTLTPEGRKRYSEGLSKHYRKASEKGEQLHSTADSYTKAVKDTEYASKKNSYKLAKAEKKGTNTKKIEKLTSQQKDIEARLGVLKSRQYSSIKASEKWDAAMADAFKNVYIKNISPEDLEIGRRYVNILINNRDKKKENSN